MITCAVVLSVLYEASAAGITRLGVRLREPLHLAKGSLAHCIYER
jgi:hypothetical protein